MGNYAYLSNHGQGGNRGFFDFDSQQYRYGYGPSQNDDDEERDSTKNALNTVLCKCKIIFVLDFQVSVYSIL